jgi:hypothetical protein
LEAFHEKQAKESRTAIRFAFGTLWTKVKRFSDKVSRFELELPTAVAGVRGTVYQTTVADDSTAEVKVYDGEVAVKNKRSSAAAAAAGGAGEVAGPQEVPGPHEVAFDEWVHIVRSMQKMHINKQGKPGTPRKFEPDPSDKWEKWNRERDQRIARVFAEPR